MSYSSVMSVSFHFAREKPDDQLISELATADKLSEEVGMVNGGSLLQEPRSVQFALIYDVFSPFFFLLLLPPIFK